MKAGSYYILNIRWKILKWATDGGALTMFYWLIRPDAGLIARIFSGFSSFTDIYLERKYKQYILLHTLAAKNSDYHDYIPYVFMFQYFFLNFHPS